MIDSALNYYLYNDVVSKKPFESKYHGACSECSMAYEEGDSIYFYGREKLCELCHSEIVETMASSKR